jgi:hypothetical protein
VVVVPGLQVEDVLHEGRAVERALLDEELLPEPASPALAALSSFTSATTAAVLLDRSR